MLTEISIQLEESGEAMEAAVSAGPVEDLPRPVASAAALSSGLPQDLGKRSAFPTATLKTRSRFQQLPQPQTSSWSLLRKKKGFS
jgi:hypothetical protein